MYVTHTTATTADQPRENATIVAEELVRWLLSQEGRSLGLSFWESREVAERHRVARMQFIERMTSVADVQVEESTDFEVTFAALSERLAELSR